MILACPKMPGISLSITNVCYKSHWSTPYMVLRTLRAPSGGRHFIWHCIQYNFSSKKYGFTEQEQSKNANTGPKYTNTQSTPKCSFSQPPRWTGKYYSWGHLVVPNTEELISRPFLDENSIRQLFWDRVNPWPATGGLALLQLQLCLQLQQNTMVPVDVDGQICHFCSQVFVTRNKSLWTKVTNLTIHINGNHGVLLKL